MANKIEDLRRCGAGLDAHCCIYILAGADGITCGRGTSAEPTLRANKTNMHAKWEPSPDIAFPDCQEENIRTRS